MATWLIAPVSKKSSDSMADFITYFERLAAANDWDDRKRAVIFPSLLEIGNKSLDGFSEGTLSSFTQTKKALLGETEPFRESNCAELMNLEKKPGEALSAFRERIAGLIEKVYPKFAMGNKQCLIRDFFVHKLPRDYQRFLLTANSSKIEDALNAALRYESTRIRSSYGTPLLKSDSYTNNHERGRYRYATNIKCYYCHGAGHYAANCHKKARENEYLPGSKNVNALNGSYFVTLQVSNRMQTFMLDTGAAVSILPEGLFETTTLENINLTLADGRKLVSAGKTTQNLYTIDGQYLCSHEFCVANIRRAYLGRDVLRRLDAVIHIGEGVVTCRGGIQIKLTTSEQNTEDCFPVLSDIDYDDGAFLTKDVETTGHNDAVCHEGTPDVDKLLREHSETFKGIGKTTLVQHYIPTTDNVPINIPSYRLPMHLKNKASQVISEMLQQGIIVKSCSEYASPVILVKKKNTDVPRVVIDFRALNAKTTRDAFTAPRVDDIIDSLSGATVFSQLDIRSAYHNIMIAPEDRHKTAFRFNGELFEYTRVPYGLCSAPATFCRLISMILHDYKSFCLGYFDDIIIFSKNNNEHYQHISDVLDKLGQAGLKLNKEKCKFFTKKVEFLGFTIEPNKISVAESKIDTIKNFPIPKTVKEVKRFVGLANFYRKLINKFSIIVSPLNKLLCKNVIFRWNEKCHDSFETLKGLLSSYPVVCVPNLDDTFVVKVDASKTGIGCILEQRNEPDGESCVIAYASKQFNKHEINYPSIEQEAFALIFALKHWRHYLIGKSFIVETDNKTVQWLRGKRDCLGRLGRWSLYLENFDFSTKHVPGKRHVGADCLSRMHELGEINIDNRWIDDIECDPVMRDLIDESIVKSGTAYVTKTSCNEESRTIIVPKTLRMEIFRQLHDDCGHNGLKKTLRRFKERFYWPNMAKDIKDLCKQCHICAISKDNNPPNSAPLVPIATSALEPFQKVAVDILGPLPVSNLGNKYLVVFQDYFTKWPEVIALEKVDSDAIQTWLVSDVISRFGVFNELITDQGTQFVCESFKLFCKNFGIKHRTTSPFHPATDGQVERLNRSILNMLRSYVAPDQKDWDEKLPAIMFSYRSAVHESIGCSPAEALQVRKLRLPIDVLCTSMVPDFKSKSLGLDDIIEKMRLTRTNIRTQAEKSLKTRQRQYDKGKKRSTQHIEHGDRVYWKKPITKKGLSPKLSKIWHGPYKVLSQLGKVNYEITDLTGNKAIVHVNNLKLSFDNNELPGVIRKRGRPKKCV